jgi:hypothetical protein
VPATPAGDQQLLQLSGHQPGQRVWAMESSGDDGAGLRWFLAAHQEHVVELDRPKRPARGHGATSDPLDATRRLARRWAATSSPSRAPPASGRHCRCG